MGRVDEPDRPAPAAERAVLRLHRLKRPADRVAGLRPDEIAALHRLGLQEGNLPVLRSRERTRSSWRAERSGTAHTAVGAVCVASFSGGWWRPTLGTGKF